MPEFPESIKHLVAAPPSVQAAIGVSVCGSSDALASERLRDANPRGISIGVPSTARESYRTID